MLVLFVPFVGCTSFFMNLVPFPTERAPRFGPGVMGGARNSDLVVCFYRDGRLHVRVRSEGSDSEDQEEEVLETEAPLLGQKSLSCSYVCSIVAVRSCRYINICLFT